MDDTEQSLVNELDRLDRAIEARKKRIAAVREKRLVDMPHRYVIDLPIKVQTPANSARLQLVTRSFVIDKDCKAFRARRIEMVPSAIGTLDDEDTIAANLSLAPMNRALSFQWKIRDTYTDRAWSSDWLPDLAAASGKNGGFLLDRPAVLPSGTIVEVSVMPILTFNEVSFFLSSVTEYAVQVALVGDKVAS